MTRCRKKPSIFKVIDNIHKDLYLSQGLLNEDELYEYMADDSDYFDDFTEEEIDCIKEILRKGILLRTEKEEQKNSIIALYKRMYGDPEL